MINYTVCYFLSIKKVYLLYVIVNVPYIIAAIRGLVEISMVKAI